jgi:2-polyprenyl-3-methyl-5-hydroxy-6-metoxy-1,4-benzoquinol methylase
LNFTSANDLERVDEMLNQYYESKVSDYFQEERHEMLKYIPQGAEKILDVGCGSGRFGHILKSSRNLEVWGVELDPDSALEASQKLDRVINAAFDSNLNLPRKKFDCIVFNDVLEHLADPWNALTYSKELLSDSGVIISSIPNVRYFGNIWDLLVNKNWEYTEWGILDKTHLRFFTKRSILSMFDSLNFDVEFIAGINQLHVLHPQHVKKFRIINRLLFNNIEDMNHLQFALVARPRKS